MLIYGLESIRSSIDSNIISGYVNKEEKYIENGKDSFEYIKYYYNESNDVKFINNENYQELSEEDVDYLSKYFKRFEKLFEYDDNKDTKYDFDINDIKSGDFYILDSKYENEDEKYDNYTVYYYNLNKHILYYLHFNM